ncbi:MAG: LuxR C-terminal-related transcriptional regulator [Acidimicrobiia bacterium]
MGDVGLGEKAARPTSPLSGVVRVAVANDFEIIVAGLGAMLAPFGDRVEVVDAILVGEPLVGRTVDVVLYDSYGREGSIAEQLEALLSDPGVSHVVLYTLSWDEAFAAAVLKRKVSGVLAKGLPAARLVGALEAVAAGEVVIDAGPRQGTAADEQDWPGRRLGLTERESEVLVLVAAGLRNREIATTLFVSHDTVKTHLAKAYRKLGVANRSQATALVVGDPSFRRSR